MYYNEINVSEGTDINKSKECIICHYCFLKDIRYKFVPYVCNECHDIQMRPYKLENIKILNMKGVNYRCIMWTMTRNDAINRLKNSKLGGKGLL